MLKRILVVGCSEYSKPDRRALAGNDELRPGLGSRVQGEVDEGRHQEGGLGGARADAGGDGHDRHRQLRLLHALGLKLSLQLANATKQSGETVLRNRGVALLRSRQ